LLTYLQGSGYANLNRADFNHCYLGAIIHRHSVDDCTLTTELTKKHIVLNYIFNKVQLLTHSGWCVKCSLRLILYESNK